jgi:predicted TIM-barrel fold metal-dependent hydrolase
MTPVADAPIIDAWAQVPYKPEHMIFEPARNVFEAAGTLDAVASPLDPAAVIAQMDEVGIQKLLVSAWHLQDRWHISNDDVAEVVAHDPERFIGVAAVPLTRPMEAVRELERAVSELGFKALRILPWLWERAPTDRLYYPLFAKCVELDVPFCTQAGHTGPLMPSEPGRPVPYLDRVALDFPELVIVAGHIGYPWTDEMIGVAWKHQNVYIDTSAWAPRYYPPQLLHYMRTYGREKVLFGTNFPQMQFERCVREAKALDLPDEVASAFFSKNARRVFKL